MLLYNSLKGTYTLTLIQYKQKHEDLVIGGVSLSPLVNCLLTKEIRDYVTKSEWSPFDCDSSLFVWSVIQQAIKHLI